MALTNLKAKKISRMKTQGHINHYNKENEMHNSHTPRDPEQPPQHPAQYPQQRQNNSEYGHAPQSHPQNPWVNKHPSNNQQQQYSPHSLPDYMNSPNPYNMNNRNAPQVNRNQQPAQQYDIPRSTQDKNPYNQAQTPAKEAKNQKPLKHRKITQFILNLLYGSLIISALIGVAAIVFGTDEYGGKAFGTIILLLFVNGLLVLGLLPKNAFYRYGIWLTSILAFAFTTLGIWIPEPPIDDIYDYTIGAPWTPQITASLITEKIGNGLWLMLFTIVLLMFVSIAEPLIKTLDKFGKTIYGVLQIIAIGGTIPLALAIAFDYYKTIWTDTAVKLYASTFILSSTMVVILAISIIYKLVSDRNEKKKVFANQPQGQHQQPFNGQKQQSVHNQQFSPAQPVQQTERNLHSPDFENRNNQVQQSNVQNNNNPQNNSFEIKPSQEQHFNQPLEGESRQRQSPVLPAEDTVVRPASPIDQDPQQKDIQEQ